MKGEVLYKKKLKEMHICQQLKLLLTILKNGFKGVVEQLQWELF